MYKKLSSNRCPSCYPIEEKDKSIRYISKSTMLGLVMIYYFVTECIAALVIQKKVIIDQIVVAYSRKPTAISYLMLACRHG